MTLQTKLMDVEYKSRVEERLREKARHDEAQALHHAEQRGTAKRNIEIARNALQMRMTIDDIVKLTGLARDEVENLR